MEGIIINWIDIIICCSASFICGVGFAISMWNLFGKGDNIMSVKQKRVKPWPRPPGNIKRPKPTPAPPEKIY